MSGSQPLDVLLINPPYQTLTSRFGVGHQVPLGLLSVGGPLLDAGHRVRLLDAEAEELSVDEVSERVERVDPDLVMTGHAGSTPAHPVTIRMLRAIRRRTERPVTIYGGVFPTYHAARILTAEPAVDVVVRGEGEETALDLAAALAPAPWRDTLPDALGGVPGLAFRGPDGVVETPPRPPTRRLDELRIGWELIADWDRHRCFGLGRAAIVQFSRGCPHRCTYCGQHGFWVRWRHRDPVTMADEIAWLHRRHGIRFITLADENPTTLKPVWRRFLEELSERRVDVSLFATIRASDLVRDADLLPLYRRAGILYVLMGIESTDDRVLARVNKGSTASVDAEACRLLREHGIFSIIGHVAGLGEESWSDFRRTRRRLAAYDGDYLNAMYATPHSWTDYAREEADRQIVEPDQERWDYRHQVLAHRRLEPWQLFLAVKLLELAFHLRPRRLWRLLRLDRFRRRQAWWCQLHTGAVWLGELLEFISRRRAPAAATSLRQAAQLDELKPPQRGRAA